MSQGATESLAEGDVRSAAASPGAQNIRSVTPVR
jgi:hypothetical protein